MAANQPEPTLQEMVARALSNQTVDPRVKSLVVGRTNHDGLTNLLQISVDLLPSQMLTAFQMLAGGLEQLEGQPGVVRITFDANALVPVGDTDGKDCQS